MISTRCWAPTGMFSTRASGSTSRPNSRDSRRMSARALRRSRKPEPVDRFEAEHDVFGHGEDGDQHEVLVDHADAPPDRSPGSAKRTGWPSMRISPESACSNPNSMFISVVLPAPFSPRRQWTSPSSRVRSTPSFATSGPNDLVMPTSSSLMAPYFYHGT